MIDPSLLADVDALGGSRARQWLDALPTAVGDSEAAIVPFGDPDLAAVAASGPTRRAALGHGSR